jgi:hypothetical protein
VRHHGGSRRDPHRRLRRWLGSLAIVFSLVSASPVPDRGSDRTARVGCNRGLDDVAERSTADTSVPTWRAPSV